jgi:hypothetical protein
MAHLLTMRKGWQSEHLAKFLLSQIAFLANPSLIADDIGSDFICTLFQIQKRNSRDYLIPKNSFAIQIKSNLRTVELTRKISYLAELEMPYFLGIINKSSLSLTIYSGEYFSQFISLITPNRLFATFKEERSLDYFEDLGKKNYNLFFPKILDIRPNLNNEQVQSITESLTSHCIQIQENISSRRNKEYIFKHFNSKLISIISGRDSSNTFRNNFFMRLAEYFKNLDWIFENRKAVFNKTEFEILEELLIKLRKINQEIPTYVEGTYRTLKNKI